MISDVVKINWIVIRKWWKKRNDDQLTKIDSKREHNIGILQKRYGYTKEEATFQLDKYYTKAKLC